MAAVQIVSENHSANLIPMNAKNHRKKKNIIYM